MASSIKKIKPLNFPWETSDPFLFCVHHADHYPKGNEEMGPDASLAGRNIGQDFTIKDGWRMYHGSKIPGFPPHPHRGFETVTVVTKGFIDHSDSLGATARFGNGDVQWMTAGKGLQHSEMFPLLNRDEPNPLELFQIWLNLPKKSKMVEPHFGMLWNESISKIDYSDENDNGTQVTLIAGKLDDYSGPQVPPNSWAAEEENEVAVWIIDMEPNAEWTIPAAGSYLNRTIYYFEGEGLRADDQNIPSYHGVELISDQETVLKNGDQPARLLMLQGKPISEPVVQYGPFVMNSQEGIQQAMMDYQKDQFGGWPWPTAENVHAREKGRFAVHADGKIEEM